MQNTTFYLYNGYFQHFDGFLNEVFGRAPAAKRRGRVLSGSLSLGASHLRASPAAFSPAHARGR
jgi:hypothetical protein